MGELGSGAEAGAVGGLVFGIMEGLIAYFEILYFGSSSSIGAVFALGLGETSAAAAIVLIGTVVGSLIVGSILGAIYGVLYEHIPGRSAYVKAGLVSSIPWFSVFIVVPLLGADLVAFALVHSVGGLLSSATYALVLGFLYLRYEPAASMTNPYAT